MPMCLPCLLITIVEHLARNLDHGKQTDVLLLDFSKAFNTVLPHKCLLKKLDHYGVHGQQIKWIESWPCGRTQTVVINGTQSSPTIVTSGVLQGTILGSLMFLLYINDNGLQITSELALFADDSVLYGIVSNNSSAELLQSDLNKLTDWSEKWQMASNASKCFLLRVTRSRSNVVNYTYTVTISHASLHMSLRHASYLELKRSMLSCLLPSLQNGVFGY